MTDDPRDIEKAATDEQARRKAAQAEALHLKPMSRGMQGFAMLLFFLLGVGAMAFVLINPFGLGFLDRGANEADDSAAADGATVTAPLYQCPMHPEVIESDPETPCPICGMRLQEMDAPDEAAAVSSSSSQQTLYQCPMHPEVIESDPETPCPICGMRLQEMDAQPVDAGRAATGGDGQTIHIDPSVVQNTGIVSVPVQVGSIERTVRTVGILDFNADEISWINTKFSGWIEKVYVVYVGQQVEAGQPLFEIYSPELVTTQEEYLRALEYAASLDSTDRPEPQRQAASLLRSTRERLLYWDISEDQIRELEQSRQTQRRLTVVSTVSGVVTKVMHESLEGRFVKAGMDLYKIADLSTVWVHADVYEADLPWVRDGQPADVSFRNEPGRRFQGEVLFLYPEVSRETRTLKICVEIPNEDNRLRAGMFADVLIRGPEIPGATLIPRSAVLRSGERDLVFVDRLDGHYEPRKVTLGIAGPDESIQILSGLESGEHVVTQAQFMLDSESRVQEAIAQFRQRSAAGVRAMIERIIETCVRNKLFVMLITLAVIGGGAVAMRNIPLDAIPDLSDVQVIVYTTFPGQAPQVVEDQVTYPLTTKMLAVPFAKDVRGYSFFGVSFVYVIFEDGTDLYWARSRVLEYLAGLQNSLPESARVELGPDATGVGWVYEYALRSDRHSLQELRSIQDFYLRYELTSVEGVAEVASVGGYVKQYQVTVDPLKLQGYGIPLSRVRQALRRSNEDVGGRLVEMAETEFMVRGLGYFKSLDDIRNVPLSVSRTGTPILVGDVADVGLGPELRRGLVELDGEGEVVGGIVVMRLGENAMSTISRVKQKIETLKGGLPEGVEVVPVYDRSTLIENAIDVLSRKLIEELIIVAIVCVLFLLHFRSAFVALFTLPVGILVAFLVMYWLGVNANIMSLGGIAIAIGVMVDASVVMVENAHKHLEQARSSGKPFERDQVIIAAAKEVGPALFYSLVIVTLSFLPVFSLQAQEGRLFRPLAFTKTFSMAAAAVLAITIIPVLMSFLIRGHIVSEKRNPLSLFFIAAYRPFIHFALRFPKTIVVVALLVTVATVLPYRQLGKEFIPPLYEGDFLWMPTTDPGISITKSKELLQQTNKIIATFPEVQHTFAKIGRAETSTDPAPLSMIETTIQLRPTGEWPQREVERFYSDWPLPAKLRGWLEDLWPETAPARTPAELDRAINEAIRFPGLTNAGMEGPIKVRLDMLATGIRAPVGIKIAGPDLETLQELAQQVAQAVETVPGAISAYPDRTFGGNYLDFEIDRVAAARYGLTVGDVQDVIMTAIGGRNITQTVEGRERYPVNLRYQSELRDDPEKLARVLVPTARGEQIPLGQLTHLRIRKGPPAIKSENARLNAWIQVSIREDEVDLGTFVEQARQVVADTIEMPVGYSLKWAGRYEYMQRAQQRLMLVVPLTVLIIFVLLYMHFRSVTESLIVLLTVPFSLVGGVWLMYALDYNMSVAVAVGFIALAGLAAETGIVMLAYLDEAVGRRRREGRLNTMTDLYDGILEGALLRVRPKLMTVATTILALLPVMAGSPFASGSQVMQRIATPMVGGLASATVLTLLILPAVYMIWQGVGLRREIRG